MGMIMPLTKNPSGEADQGLGTGQPRMKLIKNPQAEADLSLGTVQAWRRGHKDLIKYNFQE